MTKSSDAKGMVRAFELTQLKKLIGTFAREDESVVVGGDFNFKLDQEKDCNWIRGITEDIEEIAGPGSAVRVQATGAHVTEGGVFLKWPRAEEGTLRLGLAHNA